MNILDETLKHDWEVSLTNAINIMLTPENFTITQQLDAREALRKMKMKLETIDTFQEEENVLHNFCGANRDRSGDIVEDERQLIKN